MVREQGGVTGVNISTLRPQEVCRTYAHDQVVNFFHLVEVSKKNLENMRQILLSKYSEKSDSRGYRGGVCPRRLPLGWIHGIELKDFVVQSLSCVWLFGTPWTATQQDSLFFIICQSLLKLMSIEWVMLSSHLILCHPHLLLRSYLPSIRVFSNESALRIRWQKYWSFSISPSSEYSGLIFFRIDWLDLLAVQGAVKTLIQHHT